MGDQLFTIAVIWFAVSKAGSDAGLVSAAGLITGLFFGLLGGYYADLLNRRKTMIAVDVLRAIIVGILPILSLTGHLRLWSLFVVVVLVAMLGALFDPSLQASLTRLCGDEASVSGMNALLESNHRLARILGPGMTGPLLLVVSMANFFTLDSVSFIISAFVLLILKQPFDQVTPVNSIPTTESRVMNSHNTFVKDISLAFTLLRRHQKLFTAIISLGVVNFLWSTVFMIGTPLLVKNNFHQGIGLYGVLTGAYGIGNVVSLLATGGVGFRRNIRIMFVGQIILGIGFLILSTTSDIPLAILGIIVAAFGSPMGDLVLLNMIQSDFPSEHVGKVYSFRGLVGNLGLSVGLLVSVALYKVLPIATVMLLASTLIVIVGVVGIMTQTVVYRAKID